MDFHAKNIKQFKELIKWAIKFSLSENAMSLDFWPLNQVYMSLKLKILIQCGFLKDSEKLKDIYT